jgi:hypothetical protein
MRERDRLVVGFSLVVLLAGFVFLLCSQIALTVESDDGGVENGVDYSVFGSKLPENQSLSRYYRTGESLSVLFRDALNPPVPTDVPADFLIFSPSGKLCNLTFWMETVSNPYPSTTAAPLIVMIADFSIWEIDGMELKNSSYPKFIGKATEEGNYTLVYKVGSAWTAIRSMVLSKVTWSLKYPYTSMMPIGGALLAVGTVLCVVGVWDSRRRTKRKLSH